MLGGLLIFRPSVGQIFFVDLLNTGLVSLILLVSYPLFLLSYFFVLSSSDKSFLKKLITRFTLLFSVLILISSYYFKFAELRNYPNYVYTQFHIYLPFLEEFAYFQGVVLALSLFFIFKGSDKNNMQLLDVVNLIRQPSHLIGLILVALVIQSLLKFPGLFAQEFKDLRDISVSSLNFEDRLVDLPRFASQGVLLRDNIPHSAVVLHPSQGDDFPELSNQVLLRYFLYPRTLVSPGKTAVFFNNYQNNECKLYSLLTVNPDRKGVFFPKYKVDFEELTYLSMDGNKRSVYNGTFDESFIFNKSILVGVIKHKRCEL